MSEVKTPGPLLPQPFGDEDWRAWAGRLLAWLREQWSQVATKEDVRQQIEAAFKKKGL